MSIAKKTKEDLFDQGIANRLLVFRKEYIDESQKDAAIKMGVTASWLSRAERAERRVRMDVVETMVKKFNLNTEWFTTGNGSKVTKNPLKPTAGSSLSETQKDVMIIRQAIQILEANLTHAYKIIENQNKKLELLENKIASLS